ncbi:MAG: ribonuclease HII [Nitrososphaeria archaeon]|jgi:ribonuclease H, mammalian HI/archaeal HII subfamily
MKNIRMQDERVIGIDEAGRGSFIGPLVIAGFSIPYVFISRLKELGVKDSKKLTPAKRTELYVKLKKLECSSVLIYKLSPQLIDSYVWSNVKNVNLNYLEALYMAKIINRLPGNYTVVDAADVSESLFLKSVLKNVKRNVILISSHHADDLYSVVSAASIVAKVVRDKEIEKLHKVYGNFGSGYPSDPKTLQFLKSLKDKPEIFHAIRLSWKTLNKLNNIRFL